MVLFNWGWSCLINKLSLIRSLNLFASEARISKWSKSIEQLHSSRGSDTAYCLTHLRCFPVKLDIPMCSAALVKKWWYVEYNEFATSSMVDPPWNFLSPLSDMFPQHHFKKKLSHQIQCWLHISCGKSFVWEMTYPLGSLYISGGGNILHINIKIKCHAGRQNLEIMTFRYLKTLVLTSFFKNYNIWCFYFWRVSLVITPPLYDYLILVLYIHLSLIHFRKIDMTTKNFGGPLPLFRGGWCHGTPFKKIPCSSSY